MRILPLVAVLLFIAAALLMLSGSVAHAGGIYGAGSSLEIGEAGLSQARSYLAEVAHLPVETLGRPIARAELPDQGVVFSVKPRLVRIEHRHERGHRERTSGGKDAEGGAGRPGGGGQGPSAPPQADGQDHGDAAPDHGPAKGSPDADEPNAKGPSRITPLLSPGEEAWLARGGRLVLALDSNRGDLSIQPLSDATGTVGKVLPDLPAVQRLSPAIQRSISGTAALSAAPVFVIADAPLIMHQQIGRGDLWLLSCPEVWSNAHLAEADHLSLLIGVADGRPVFFDEFSHGAEHDLGVSELLRRWHLGPACLLGMLGVACWLWRRGQVVGAVAEPWRDRRIAAVEGVDAIANLYYQALSPRDCLHLYRSRLLRMIMLRTGAKAVAASRILKLATPGLRLPPPASSQRMPEREFGTALTILTTAFQEYSDERVH
jgi:hypothetical protein